MNTPQGAFLRPEASDHGPRECPTPHLVGQGLPVKNGTRGPGDTMPTFHPATGIQGPAGSTASSDALAPASPPQPALARASWRFTFVINDEEDVDGTSPGWCQPGGPLGIDVASGRGSLSMHAEAPDVRQRGTVSLGGDG